MKVRNAIQKPLAMVMLLALTITCVPKHFLHSAFANHKHVTYKHTKSEHKQQINTNTNCNFSYDGVAISFLQSNMITFSNILFAESTYILNGFNSHTAPISYTNLRGPPTA